MKAVHAYLILAHAHFGQLKTLLSLLDDGRNDIYIHIDARSEGWSREGLQSTCRHAQVRWIEPRIATHWGGVSLMRAELALLKAALPGHYRYYHLLSGMDLPIKTQDAIHTFFERNDGKEFVEFWEMQSHTRNRAALYTLFPEGAGNFAANLANNLFKLLQKAVGYRRNRDVDFHQGSQWFSITDACARFVVSQEAWLEKVFSHANTVDELFLPTLLWNSPFRERLFDATLHAGHEPSQANMRLIDWSRGESIRHPWTFRDYDFEMLTNAPQLWARKFDDSIDAEIIRMLVRHIKGELTEEERS